MSDNDFFGGRRRRRAGAAFSPYSLFASGEQGVWYDPSDLTPEKVSWRRNLLTYTQDFENAAWTKSNASILSNLMLYSQEFGTSPWVLGGTATVTSNTTTAPDGTTTADTLSYPASSNTVYQQSAATLAGVTYTMSVWLRADSPGTIRIAFANDGTKGVDVSVTTSWTRFTYTNTTAAGNDGMQIRRDSAGQLSAVYAWGAQLVPGSTAQTYTRSLATAAPIQFADPLGGTLADKLVENTANSTHRVLPTIPAAGTAGATYTFSVYVKAAERTACLIDAFAGTAETYVYVDLSTGAAGNNSGPYTIISVGSGWYRITATVVANSTAGLSLNIFSATNTTGTGLTYTGDGVSGILIYGAQVEQASTASAYQRITDFSSDFLAAFPTHALYQESTATTAVTTLGQSVGYVVDKRLGGLTALGPNLVTNGTFSNGTTGWTLAVNASVTVEPSFAGKTNVVRTVNNSSSGVTTSQTITGLTAGRSYLVTFDAYAPSPNALVNIGACYVTETASLRVTPTGEDAWQSRQFIFTASGTSTTLSFNAGTSGAGSVQTGDQALLGNFTLREVPGNHALQATSAARPTLQARSNLLTYSEQFDNAAWTKSSSTVTANTAVAPDGTSTADKSIVNNAVTLGSGSGAGLRQDVTKLGVALTYTQSVYAKAVEFNRLQVWMSNLAASASAYATFDLANGTVVGGSIGGTFTNKAASVESVGNGWYRCILTATTDTDTSLRNSYFPTDSVATTGNGTSGVLVWGGQIELGSTATTYQRVTTATDYADVGLPRNLTFDGVDDSLATAGNVDFATWTVGSRRNLLTVPTMFDDAAWTASSATITANTTAAPDGTTTADTIAFSANNGRVQRNVNMASQCLSIYVKPIVGTRFALNTDGASGADVTVFNLSGSGSVVSTGANNNSSVITALSDGWYRLVTARGATAGTTIYLGALNAGGGSTDSFYIWGAQLEVGSTATAFQDVGTDKVTLFSGVTKLSDAALGMMAELTTGGVAGSFYVLAPNGAASPAYQWRSAGSILVNVDTPTTYAAPITNVLTGIGNIGGDVATIRINGAQAATSSADQGTGNYASALLYVGRRASTSLPFNGRLFQLVIRGAATDSVTVGNAERWVGQLTGVAL